MPCNIVRKEVSNSLSGWVTNPLLIKFPNISKRNTVKYRKEYD